MQKTKHSPSDKIEGLSDDTWAAIKRASEVHEYSIDERVQEHGELDERLRIVVAGELHLLLRAPEGERNTGWIKTAGETIGNASFHLQIPKPLSAVAIEEKTRVLSIGRDAVYDHLLKLRDFAEYLFKDISQQTMKALLYLQEERELPAQLRVARRLSELSNQSPNIEYSLTDFANILGVTRLTVAKALENLEREGFVERTYGGVTIKDPENFRRWIAERIAEVSELYRDAASEDYLH